MSMLDTHPTDTVERTIDGPHGSYPIAGTAQGRFDRVVEAFCEHFRAGAELGASACVMIGGEVVVDLWGGYADLDRTRPWKRDTICNVMSVSKGFTATCLHVLVDRGIVDLDAPVATYWPEFAANGKADLPVRWLTDQRAGLPVLAEDLSPGAIFDWEAMTSALARQAPIVEPGRVAAYHIRTSGFLIGEVIRRATGVGIAEFLRREIAEPFDIDFHFGMDDEKIARTADFEAAREGTLLDASTYDRDSLIARAGRQMPARLDYNGEAYRRAVIPSSNGHGNGRSVARLYSILANGGSCREGLCCPAGQSRWLGPNSIVRPRSFSIAPTVRPWAFF